MRINSKLLIPWTLFSTVLVAGFALFQWEFNLVQKDVNQHLKLHQDSVRLARDLRFLSQERQTTALSYHGGALSPVLNELTASENRTNAIMARFTDMLNANARAHRDNNFEDQGQFLLKRYALARQNLPVLYREWLDAVNQRSTLEPVKRIQLNQLFLTVRASLDDLAEFHEITQQLVNANARTQLREFQIAFYAVMGFLLLLLLGFSFYQGHTISQPLGQLSKVAQALAKGETAQFKVKSDIDEVSNLGQSLFDMLENLKASHAEVMRQEERFQKVIHASPIAMLVVDTEGRIVMLNPTTEAMFGYAQNALSGQLIETLLPERFRVQHVGLRTQFLSQPTAVFLNAKRGILGRRADGSEFPVEVGLNPIQTSDGPMVLAIMVDITDRLALENERMAYQMRLESDVQTRTAELTRKTGELELAMKDLESFSYSVSHDLRAPLRAIDGFLQILLDEHAEQLAPDGRRMFSIVQENARKMGHLIDDILAFSRAGRLEMDWQDIDMNRMLQDAWSSVSNAQQGHGAQLDAQPLPSIKGDPRAVRQILVNLLDNAVKFSRTRQPGRVCVFAESAGKMVRFTVQDNGVGFNPDFSSKLFVMFQRLHGVNEFEGTGVGLAIVKRFVMKHGGEVQASAKLNEGAAFSFTLPSEIPAGIEFHPDQPAVPGFA
jgi:PAS domain S-box-containing protein